MPSSVSTDVNVSLGSKIRIRAPSESGLHCGAKLTFDPERRQCGGFRAFKRSGLNSRFVPIQEVREMARRRVRCPDAHGGLDNVAKPVTSL